MPAGAAVFVTGGTGYIGRPLIESLIAQGYAVDALVRAGSQARLPAAAHPVIGDALDAGTFATAIPRGATVVHLVGTPHPGPGKAAEFVRATGLPATLLRPWYVLGPGHYWPYVLIPVYAMLRLLPATRANARRLGLVTRQAMVAALVNAIAAPPTDGVRIVEVPEIGNAIGEKRLRSGS